MKQSFLLFLFVLNISACTATSTPPITSVNIQETKTFADVEQTIKSKTQEFGPSKVLVVVDIDNTLLTGESDLGSDIWYQWQRGNLAVKPNSDQLVQCLFEDSINLLYELSPMKLTEATLPKMVATWQDQGLTVFALTSRSPRSRSATERELMRAGIDLSKHPLNLAGQVPLILREFIPREMSYMQGIMMTSGMNKGVMLNYILEKMQRKFDVIIFVDDSQNNIDNLYAEFKNVSNLDMTLFHYTQVEDQRLEENGQILSQSQADTMAQQWNALNQLLNSIYPSRQSDSCLNIN